MHLLSKRISFVIFALTILRFPLLAQNQASESEVKAAFIYNFARFVDWPAEIFADSSKPLVIGILPNDPVAKDLENAVGGKTVRDRNIIIRKIAQTDDLLTCHIVYFGSGSPALLADKLAKLKSLNVLTIGDHTEFLHLGGIVRFFLQDKKLRFEVNLSKAEDGGLKISSRLLKLAEIYAQESGGSR